MHIESCRPDHKNRRFHHENGGFSNFFGQNEVDKNRLPHVLTHNRLSPVWTMADFLASHDQKNQKIREFSKLLESVFDAHLLFQNRRWVKLFGPKYGSGVMRDDSKPFLCL